jgi:hypothetical protein
MSRQEPKSGREVYQSLCEARDLRRAVCKLAPAELTAAADYLGAMPGLGTVPRTVWEAVRERLREVAR